MILTASLDTAAPILSREEQMRRFLTHADWAGAALSPLQGDASFRRYIRLHKKGASAMLMDAPPEREKVRPYMQIARFLHEKGYSAPAILAEDVDAGFLLLEDLGDALFTPLLQTGGALVTEQTLYTSAIELLARWHRAQAFQKENNALALPDYDRQLLLQEVSLFSDWYLPAVIGEEEAKDLREDYLGLWEKALAQAPLLIRHFVHRDFHASNLMWLPERAGQARVGLLDFQDAVWGDPAYDLVSLLEDARRDVPAQLAAEMLEHYLRVSGAQEERLRTAYAVLGAQRNAKIIGIFVRLWRRDGKRHYLPLLPRVWRYYERDLQHPLLADIKAWTDRHIDTALRGEIGLA